LNKAIDTGQQCTTFETSYLQQENQVLTKEASNA
jgi:hypothetical protein